MDWKQVITDIKDSGLTQEQIAQCVGVSVGTLSELLHGKVMEPKWSKGSALLRLHAARFSHQPDYRKLCCED